MDYDRAAKWRGLLILMGICTLLPGCQFLAEWMGGADPTPSDYIFEEFSETMENFGLIAVLPPQEDIRVGDIYFYPEDPARVVAAGKWIQGTRRIPAVTRWGSLPVREELEKEYQTRPAWPPTPDDYLRISSDPENRSWPEPRTEGSASIFEAGAVTNRLPLVNLGQFSAATFSEGGLNRLIPTEAVNMVNGTGWLDWKAVTLRPLGAETYSLPLERLIDLMLEAVDEEVLREPEEAPSGEGEMTAQGKEPKPKAMAGTRFVLKEPLRKHLSLLSLEKSDSVWFQVLSEVVYIRGVDITVQVKEMYDEEEEMSASDFDAEVPEPTPAPEEEREAEVEGDTLDPIYGAFVRANAINKVLIDSDADDLPGGFIRFLSVTEDSLSIRRVFQRGLAVGVRGLILEVDKNSGAVIKMGLMK